MTKDQKIEVPCPICAENKPKPLFWTKDYTFNKSQDKFRLNRCPSCRCGYLSPRPLKENMGMYYPHEFYWSWEGSKDSLQWEQIIDKRRQQLEQKAEWIKNSSPGRLLDVGAQKGEFLWFMQQKGWDVEGVELDSTVPNPVDMPIRYGNFLDMNFEEEKYDIITFWAVLEHVYEPNLFIEKASRLLKPGGELIALVTNIDSIQALIYRADDYPRHLTIFSKKSIRLLCSSNQMTLDNFSTNQKIFGGSLTGGLVYVAKRLLGYTVDEVFSEWKQIKNPNLFWCEWRGKPSKTVKTISRIDRLLSYPFEVILDCLGFGFIITFKAIKIGNKNE